MIINWDEFKVKFHGRTQDAFEDLTYHLFCNEFNNGQGIFRYKNQKFIETEPVETENDIIGFQTKFYDSSPSKHASDFIDAIKGSKKTYGLTKLVFYVFPEFGQSSEKYKTKTKAIEEIENEAKKHNITIIWKVPSVIKQDLLKPENRILYYQYFDKAFVGIHNINSFIELKRNKLKPDLKNNYVKLDNFDDVLNKVKNHDFISISGNPLLGKTRLALEIAKVLYKDNYTVLIITNTSENLISNIKNVLSYEKPNLIIFDDYNITHEHLVNVIEEIRYHVRPNKVKFLFSLKKRYEPILNNLLSEFNNVTNIPLDPISNNHMRDIIDASTKPEVYIKYTAIDKILHISKGNIGICRMVINSIMNNDLRFLESYNGIYKIYFNDLELNNLTHENKIFLGVLSLFNNINFNDSDFINDLNKLCNFNINSQKRFINKLAREKIIKYEDNTCSIPDKILSIYMFHLVFVDEKLLKLPDIIMEFLPLYSSKFQNNIYDTLTIFGVNSLKDIKNQIDSTINKLNEGQLISVYRIFYLCYSEEIIVFLKDWIDNEDSEEFDFDEFEIPKSKNIFTIPPKISLLSLLFHTKYYMAALQLTLKILIKKPSLLNEILYVLKESYSFTFTGVENHFRLLNEFLDFVEKDSFNSLERMIIDKLFLFLLSEDNLFRFRHSEFKNNLGEHSIINFSLSSTESLINLRSRILTRMFSLYDYYPNEIQEIFETYIRNISKDYEKIFLNEEIQVYNFFKTLNFEKYNANRLCYLYLEQINKNNINLKHDFDFLNKQLVDNVKIYSNAFNRFDRRKTDEIRKSMVENISEESDVINTLNLMKEIDNYNSNSSIYCNLFFEVLIEKDFKLFLEAFSYYLNNNLNLTNRYYFIEFVFDKIDSLDFYNIIINSTHKDKTLIKYYFFELIPKKYISKTIFSDFMEFIRFELNEITLHYLDNYFKYNDYFIKSDLQTNAKNIVQYLIEIILEKFDEIELNFLFNFCNDNYVYFEDNFELLKTFYLTCLEKEYYDYDNSELKTLCEMNTDFIKEFFNWQINHITDFYYWNVDKIDFIWELEYDFSYIEDLIKLIVEKCEYFYLDYVNLLFSAKNKVEKDFINYFINNNSDDLKMIKVIFEVIKINYKDEFVNYLRKFIIRNSNVETFKHLVNPSYKSEVVIEAMFDESKIDFYNEIKNMLEEFNDNLDYFEHKSYINKLIKDTKENLEYEFNLLNQSYS